MSERQSLTAFCVLVGAICYLATVAALLAWRGKYAEALGFGGLTTGLVGVLGSFRPKTREKRSARSAGVVGSIVTAMSRSTPAPAPSLAARRVTHWPPDRCIRARGGLLSTPASTASSWAATL